VLVLPTRQAETRRRRHWLRCFAVQVSRGIMGNDQESDPDDREILIGLCEQLLHLLMSAATDVMYVLGEASTKLARLPATKESSIVRAGMRFTMLQGVEPLCRVKWNTFFCVSASPICPSRSRPLARGRRKLFDELAESLSGSELKTEEETCRASCHCHSTHRPSWGTSRPTMIVASHDGG
jgi:hypothetical protein